MITDFGRVQARLFPPNTDYDRSKDSHDMKAKAPR